MPLEGLILPTSIICNKELISTEASDLKSEDGPETAVDSELSVSLADLDLTAPFDSPTLGKEANPKFAYESLSDQAFKTANNFITEEILPKETISLSSIEELSKVPIHLIESPTSSLEHTIALVKPDIHPLHTSKVITEIRSKFKILHQKQMTMSLRQAALFYAEHAGKPFYQDLIEWMSSAPIYVLVLQGDDAIKKWRSLAGPTNSNVARIEAPDRFAQL